MHRARGLSSSEAYVLEHGQYALYVGNARVLVTATVGVLIDTRLHVLITHGDPVSVRGELDALRLLSTSPVTAHYEQDWLLLEGTPQIDILNGALQESVDLSALREAFAGHKARAAYQVAHELLARLAKRR